MRTELFMLLIVMVVALAAQDVSSRQSMRAGDIWEAGPYVIEVRTVTRDGRVLFRVNDEYSSALREREEHTFSDGSKILVGDILVDRPSYVEFYFVPG